MTASTTIRFREATSSDAAVLAALAAETFTDTHGSLYAADELAAHLDAKCSELFFLEALAKGDAIIVIEDHGEIIGYCKLGNLNLPVAYPPEQAQEIHRIYVRKDHHRRGLGQELLDRALEHPRLKSASVVYLGVWEGNDGAQQFYYRNGFLPVSRYLYTTGQQQDPSLILAHLVPKQQQAVA